MQVEWNNPEDPSRGFQYLYLSDADYRDIAERAERLPFKATRVLVNGTPSMTTNFASERHIWD